MKNLLLITALLLGIWTQTLAQVQREAGKGTDLQLKEGMQLLYEVDFHGKNYDFLVKVTSIAEDGGITFGYVMNNRYPMAKVNISGNALKVATGQSNAFNGRDLSLPYRTTVWISEKVFDALTGPDAAVAISPDNGKPEVEIKTSAVGYDYALDGKGSKDIAYLYAESDDGSAKYWIHHNRDNRLILKMDIGWKIWLKEVKY